MMKLEGLVSACFTPFFPDGSVNYNMIPELVEKLIGDGLIGIFVCGSNGEGPNMSTNERMKVGQAFIAAADKRIKVIVHVGHSNITEAKLLAAHAAEIGADAVSAVAAFYFKPISVGNLADCMAAIASACPDTPFYYYHIPLLTGLNMEMIEFLRIAEPLIPNLAGIKYTVTTLNEFQSCLNYKNGRFQIMYGFDELLLPALAVGARAAIGSTYTFAAPIYLETIKLFNEGKMEAAQESHAFMVEVIRRMVKHPPIPAQKAIMNMLGWDLGPSRLPLVTLSEKAFQELLTDLKEISFFEKIASRNIREANI